MTLVKYDLRCERGWLYHKNLRLWLRRSGRDEPEIKTDTYEKGSFVSFDPHTWTYVTKVVNQSLSPCQFISEFFHLSKSNVFLFAGELYSIL